MNVIVYAAIITACSLAGAWLLPCQMRRDARAWRRRQELDRYAERMRALAEAAARAGISFDRMAKAIGNIRFESSFSRTPR